MTGEQFKQMRLNAGLTQVAIAHRLGLTVTTISRWECGRNAIPDLTNAVRCAKIVLETGGEVMVGMVAERTQMRVKIVIEASRRYCTSCRSLLSQGESKRRMLCQRCRNYCTRCGAKTKAIGHYEVCVQCVPELIVEIEHARCPQKTPKPIDNMPNRDELPVCKCGDEAITFYQGAAVCSECHGERLREAVEAGVGR